MWKEGKQHGKGVFTSDNGEMREGVWDSGMKVLWLDGREGDENSLV